MHNLPPPHPDFSLHPVASSSVPLADSATLGSTSVTQTLDPSLAAAVTSHTIQQHTGDKVQ